MRPTGEQTVAVGTPFVFSPSGAHSNSLNALCAILQENREWLQAHLHRHGAILFRDFCVDGHSDFQSVSDAWYGNQEASTYSGGVSPRTQLDRTIYTSTEWSPMFRIPLHNEMAYSSTYPETLMFHCQTPSNIGGCTPLADSRRVYEALPNNIREKFDNLGVRYRRYYFERDFELELLNKLVRSHKTWMEVFETPERSVANDACKKMGLQPEWTESGGVILTNELPASRHHPITGDPVWFNQAHAFNHLPQNIGWLPSLIASYFYRDPKKFMHHAEYGDGSAIDSETILKILRTLDECTVRFPWAKRDILILDNLLCAHGRDPFIGQRKVMVSIQ